MTPDNSSDSGKIDAAQRTGAKWHRINGRATGLFLKARCEQRAMKFGELDERLDCLIPSADSHVNKLRMPRTVLSATLPPDLTYERNEAER